MIISNSRNGNNIKIIYLTFDNAPVCLPKWKAISKLCKCKNTFLAILRIECWATFANTAFLNSLNPAAPARAIPSVFI